MFSALGVYCNVYRTYTEQVYWQCIPLNIQYTVESPVSAVSILLGHIRIAAGVVSASIPSHVYRLSVKQRLIGLGPSWPVVNVYRPIAYTDIWYTDMYTVVYRIL